MAADTLTLSGGVTIDRLRTQDAATDALMVTDTSGRVIATLRVSPDAAAALVSALIPTALRAPGILDGLLADLREQPTVGG